MKHRMLLSVFFVFASFFVGLVNISAQEAESVGVKDGGVSVKGWTGKIDAKEATAGLNLTARNSLKKAKPCMLRPARLLPIGTRRTLRKATTQSVRRLMNRST